MQCVGRHMPTRAHCAHSAPHAGVHVSLFSSQSTLTAVTRLRRSVVVTWMNLHTGQVDTPPKAAKRNAMTSGNAEKPPRFGRETARQQNAPKTCHNQRKRQTIHANMQVKACLCATKGWGGTLNQDKWETPTPNPRFSPRQFFGRKNFMRVGCRAWSGL